MVTTMLRNLALSKRETFVTYHLAYDDGHGNGYWFPCDEHGTPSKALTEAALQNLEWCKAHPEQFKRAGEVATLEREYVEPAHGTCYCGEEVVLENQYYGACECPRCGRWYNLFGQSILPPGQWEGICETDY